MNSDCYNIILDQLYLFMVTSILKLIMYIAAVKIMHNSKDDGPFISRARTLAYMYMW